MKSQIRTPHQFADAPRGDVDHAVRCLLPLQLRQRAEGLGEVIAAADGVQEGRVHRIHRVVLHLEPVARQEELRGRVQLETRHGKRVVHREHGRHPGRPHVGEDQAAELVRGVRAVAQPLPQRALGGLARRLEKAAVHVEDPAVIAAADAALLENAVLERRAAVRAVQLEQADAARAIAEDDEVLAHDPDPPRHVAEVAREGHGLPEAAQVLAARRAGYRCA